MWMLGLSALLCILLMSLLEACTSRGGAESPNDGHSSLMSPSMSGESAGAEGGANFAGGQEIEGLAGLDAGDEPPPTMGGASTESDPVHTEPWVEIGTGFRTFEELSSGAEVPIIAGIQGGFHVWGAFRGGLFDDQEITILFELYLNGELIANADYFEFNLSRNNRGDFEYTGVSVIYFDNDRVEPSSGSEMTLTLTVTTRQGERLSDEIRLTPICCM